MINVHDCKVFCDEVWYPGKVLDTWPNNSKYLVEVFPGTPKAFQRVIPPNEHSRWEQISDEDVQKAALAQLDEVKDFLQQVLDKMLPGEQFSVDQETCTIIVGGGAVTMTPIAFEYRRIGAFAQVPGWSVETWHSTPASRDCPGDVSESEQGQFRHFSEAVKCLVATLFKVRLENYYDALASEEMASIYEKE